MNKRQAAVDGAAPLPQRVADSLARYAGQMLVILSGDDLTAAEFARVMARHEVRARRIDVGGASHTFASHKWRAQVAEASGNWIMSW